ncbi:MAG: hypothetical protein IT305_14215 [Chloroflexi bacterium]|nr:hypothetical protein [Chloroflexota bacterium]
MNDAQRAHAERLAELLLEQLELLDLTEHEEACILTAVAGGLIRRTVELGEVIEAEARELGDQSALQMATAIQTIGPSAEHLLERLASDPRFGLLPAGGPSHPVMPPWHEPDDPPVTEHWGPRALRATPSERRPFRNGTH